MQTLLIDLDGTLSDSAPGILSSLRRAFADVGVPEPDEATMRSMLGPPFAESLAPLFGVARVPAIIEAYRSYYDTAMFDTCLYDGMRDVLDDLRAREITLAVATSKPEAYAVPILDHLGVIDYFETIGGDSLDGSRDTKTKVIAAVLERLGTPDPAQLLMLGDRSFDVAGARAHGIGCLGAGWGYGTAGELADAVEIFATPHTLLAAHERIFGGPRAATA